MDGSSLIMLDPVSLLFGVVIGIIVMALVYLLL